MEVSRDSHSQVSSISSVLTQSTFIAASPHRAPAANNYSPKNYWKMDAQESIFKNAGGAVFGRDKSDILKEKYGIKEKALVPAPGNYNSNFSEFSGIP